MRLALSDIKKAITRRAGEVYVAPRLLRPRQHARPLAALIALYEASLGTMRAGFLADRPAELIGDYRLARCLCTCLGEWYVWQAPAWPGPATPAEAEALATAGIASPVDLRLALFDAVNARGAGYLTAAEREAALDAFAAGLGLGRVTLDALLVLDREERAVLRRLRDAAPTPEALATRYNQLALEAMLAASSTIEWTLPAGAGLGTAVKRVCFLARRMGVYYELTFETAGDGQHPQFSGGMSGRPSEEGRPPDAPTDRPAGAVEALPEAGRWDDGLPRVAEGRGVYTVHPAPPDAATHEDAAISPSPRPFAGASGGRPAEPEDADAAGRGLPRPYTEREKAEPDGENGSGSPSPRTERGMGGEDPRTLHITLYGPQEVTGAANQYGERLARLCRALLGYRRSAEAATGSAPALTGEGLRGIARVYLHGRPLTFLLDDALLALLAPAAETDEPAAAPADQFDSALESRLFAEFAGLERAGEAHGWRIEREPEPIVAGETIYVPDFALTRGARRIYLELAGYWRAEYRERKVRKLLALRGRMPLVVAAPESAREALAALDGAYPLLYYGNRLGAQALLALLDRTYDDAAERLAALDAPAVLRAVEAAGRIPAHEAMRLLACHTRAERDAALARLAESAMALGQPQPLWIAGAGLCSPAWRDRIGERLAALVGGSPGGRLPLTALRERVIADEPALAGADLTEEAVESLAAHAGLEVLRASIFAAEVAAPGANAAPAEFDAHEPPAQPRRSRDTQPRRPARRKVHDADYAAPALLDVPDGEGAPEPNASSESDP